MFVNLRTEKLWRSFYIGSVPIVYGSPKSKDIFPDNHSAIEILDFKNPKELAKYLLELNENDEEYDKYLNFKKQGGVINKILLDLMKNREWGIDNDRNKPSYIDVFECLVCERLHENMERAKNRQQLKKYQATKDHYGCPKPFTFSKEGILFDENNRQDPSWNENYFLIHYDMAYAELRLLYDKFLPEKNYYFTEKELKKEALKYYKNNKNIEKVDL